MCESQFALPPNDARLNVREMNAMDFVLDPANRNTVDILQVDLYDEAARGPVLSSQEFYQGCADVLRDGGIMTTNVFGDDFTNYDKNLQTMELVFDAVVWLPEVHDANIVVIAFKNAPSLDFSVLYERAAEIKKTLNLPAKNWVNGLKGWMLRPSVVFRISICKRSYRCAAPHFCAALHQDRSGPPVTLRYIALQCTKY
jgi:spermidine synthase